MGVFGTHTGWPEVIVAVGRLADYRSSARQNCNLSRHGGTVNTGERWLSMNLTITAATITGTVPVMPTRMHQWISGQRSPLAALLHSRRSYNAAAYILGVKRLAFVINIL